MFSSYNIALLRRRSDEAAASQIVCPTRLCGGCLATGIATAILFPLIGDFYRIITNAEELVERVG